MIKTSESSRVLWACRRGMLELDHLLVAYYHRHYQALPEADKQLFIELLACQDQDLFNWILGDHEPLARFKTLCLQIRHEYGLQP